MVTFIRKIAQWFFSIGLISSTAMAQSAVIVSREILTNFVPDDAYLFVDRGDGKIVRTNGVLIPPQGDDSKRNQRDGWRVGTKVSIVPGAKNVSHSAIIIGLKGDLGFLPPTTIDPAILNKDQIDELRGKLLQRKQVLQSWELQLQAQDGSLKRLRADAQVIGNLGRIVEIREDIARTKAQALALDQTMERLKTAIQRSRELPVPQNFSKRELQLTQQLSELVSVSSDAESSEITRRAASEAEVQRRMTMIEQSRLEDMDQLQAELDRLNAMIQRYSPPPQQP